MRSEREARCRILLSPFTPPYGAENAHVTTLPGHQRLLPLVSNTDRLHRSMPNFGILRSASEPWPCTVQISSVPEKYLRESREGSAWSKVDRTSERKSRRADVLCKHPRQRQSDATLHLRIPQPLVLLAGLLALPCPLGFQLLLDRPREFPHRPQRHDPSQLLRSGSRPHVDAARRSGGGRGTRREGIELLSGVVLVIAAHVGKGENVEALRRLFRGHRRGIRWEEGEGRRSRRRREAAVRCQSSTFGG